MSISNLDSSRESNSKSQLYPLPKLTISLTKTLSNEFALTNTTLSTSISSAPPPERETWLGSFTSGIGLSSKSRNTPNEAPIVIADLSDRPKAGILLNSVPNTPQITPSQSTDRSSQPPTPALLPQPSISLSSSLPSKNSMSFQLPPPSSDQSNTHTQSHDQSNQTRQAHSRSLTIKFAPLPDPRSMKQRSYSMGGDPHFNHETLPDGSTGDPPSALRPRDLDPLLINENHPSDHPSLNSAQPSSSLQPASSTENQSFSSHTSGPHQSIQPIHPSNLLNSPGPSALHQIPNNTIYHTPTGSTSVSSLATSSCHPPSTLPTESISRKLFNAVSKQRKPRSLNTSSSNLSYASSSESASYGAPLRQTRSVESSYSISARSSASDSMPSCLRNPILRRTKSKEEPLEQRPRRRAQYPPVAQRKVHMGGSRGGAGRVSIIEEPAFDEWGVAGGSVKGRATGTSTSASSVSDFGSVRSAIVADDDGSGMAWLRKRRQEREEKARRESDAKVGTGDESTTPTTSASHNITHQQLASVPTERNEEQEILQPSVTPQAVTLPPINTSNAELSESSASAPTSKSSAVTSTGSNTTDGVEAIRTKEEEEEEEQEEEEEDETEQVLDEEEEEEEEEDDEEEIRKEDLLQAKVLAESPFVKGVKEVYKD
ncbi:uncharacterized protein MELLADRAFT_95381 [Melampsora larici-populina 98AG31]|uniref:Uncharacterized protein n=1 Tax=Melampsora larici-populina (strain 98AG31 / pathotype 3-4-7) TaxID=747676 RepID=F4RCB7_MELLP|nr:uncharacterized protein MELLADRAFT_95381 [Melampsora larici-populina 98AG31]EGG09862.1 hypothetical protein MELLADRAFT_95381 [Melampsora larici-populina 98AG31]